MHSSVPSFNVSTQKANCPRLVHSRITVIFDQLHCAQQSLSLPKPRPQTLCLTLFHLGPVSAQLDVYLHRHTKLHGPGHKLVNQGLHFLYLPLGHLEEQFVVYL